FPCKLDMQPIPSVACPPLTKYKRSIELIEQRNDCELLNHRTTKEINTMNRLTISLLAAGLMLGAQSTRADHEKEMKDRSSHRSANEIIGKKVTNAQDEDLGKVQDIIINVEAGTAPYAVI